MKATTKDIGRMKVTLRHAAVQRLERHLYGYHAMLVAQGTDTLDKLALPESQAMAASGLTTVLKDVQQSILRLAAARRLDKHQIAILFQQHIHTPAYLALIERAKPHEDRIVSAN